MDQKTSQSSPRAQAFFDIAATQIRCANQLNCRILIHNVYAHLANATTYSDGQFEWHIAEVMTATKSLQSALESYATAPTAIEGARNNALAVLTRMQAHYETQPPSATAQNLGLA